MIAILLIGLGAFITVFGYIITEKDWVFWIGWITLVIGMMLGSELKSGDEHIVIQKSSDSEWEYSYDQTIKRDTTITRVVVLNDGRDTVYPTMEYRVIKVK